MKLHTFLIAALALVSTSAFADSYTCTPSEGAGIYTLTLEAGTATLMGDGQVHTAMGAGSMYNFDSSFEIGGVVFNDPVLELPMDGSMNEIMWTATLSDGAGGAQLELNCSH